eukprot:5533808-Amphidinium_carterae.1
MDVVLFDASSLIDFATFASILKAAKVHSCSMSAPQRRPSAAVAARILVVVEPTEEMVKFANMAWKKGWVQDIGFLLRKGHACLGHLEQQGLDHQCDAEAFTWCTSSSVWRYSGLWTAISPNHVSRMQQPTMMSVLASIVFTGLLALQPNRFLPENTLTSHDVFWIDINRDEQQWKSVLKALEDLLRDRSQISWEPPSDHPLGQRLRELIPWQLERLQVVKLPKQRRFPTDVPWLHRGCALLHVDETITLEAEAVQDNVFPRQRFSKPVSLGVFFFGVASEQAQFKPEETQQAAQREQKPRPPIPKAELKSAETHRAQQRRYIICGGQEHGASRDLPCDRQNTCGPWTSDSSRSCASSVTAGSDANGNAGC